MGVSARSGEARGGDFENMILQKNYDHIPTRRLLKVDPRGPSIPNLLHRYLLLSRTDRARLTKTENGHKTGRQGTDLTRICEIGAFLRGASF